MTPPKLKRVRTKKPKVKTGCKTCKIRRVKCDETKPQCRRCIKFGRECDGYDDPSDSTSAALKPRPVASRVADYRPIIPLTSVFSQPTISITRGPEEHQYFRYFHEHTAPALSGGFDSSVWNRIVLQTSTSEPAIHQLLISIGALSRATTLMSHESTSITNHRQYAFHEYGKGLRSIRDLAKAGDSRSILIASMLIYCFESLHGNTSGAVQYLKSVRSLTLGFEGPLVYRHLTPLPSAPKGIEADLITAFARLDGSLTNQIDSQDPTRSSVLGVKLDYYAEPYELPTQFSDPETARRYLEHIQHRSRPSLSQAEIIDPDPATQTTEIERKLSEQELNLLKSQMEGWNKAFEPLFIYGRTLAGSKDYVAVMTLKIQGLSTACLLEGMVGIVPETELPAPSSDRILELCTDMVRYGWELVRDGRFIKGYVFDFGIIPSLMIVVVSSPERALGREVVKILRAAVPRKEATWDAAQIATICEGIMMMQEMQSKPSDGQTGGVKLVEIT